jgi:hypothetical protein
VLLHLYAPMDGFCVVVRAHRKGGAMFVLGENAQPAIYSAVPWGGKRGTA